NALAVDASGNVYVTGRSYGSGTMDDYATIKYNSSGEEQWVARFSQTQNSNDYPVGIALDNSNNIYVTGYSETDTSCVYTTIKYTQIPTSVDEMQKLPREYKLSQNYPNPFNSGTRIRYALPVRARVVLKVYNTLGEEVAVLVDGEKEAGEYTVQWDAKGLPGGVYLYRLQADGYVETKKSILLK
ncbi:MAG: SBBP repeat-containing protein, partial [candidate division WOR-3 bacterium]